MLTDEERALILAVQDGLPVVRGALRAVAEQMGTTEERVLGAPARRCWREA